MKKRSRKGAFFHALSDSEQLFFLAFNKGFDIYKLAALFWEAKFQLKGAGTAVGLFEDALLGLTAAAAAAAMYAIRQFLRHNSPTQFLIILSFFAEKYIITETKLSHQLYLW